MQLKFWKANFFLLKNQLEANNSKVAKFKFSINLGKIISHTSSS